MKSSVYTHKTEVSAATVSQTRSLNYELDDVDKTCPIHKKPHPLNRCRGFRIKPLDERKTFLKEKGVCYRCCATTTHLARDCKAAIKLSLAHGTFIFDDYAIGDTIFERTKEDNKVGLSIEDRRFLDIMDKEMFMDESNSWVAPLPFRTPRQRLPNNREQVFTRLTSLLRTLEKKPEMKSHFVTFMQNIFDRDHAEVAPPLREGQECWYLPTFGVYHPQKPGQIRVVFDFSMQKQGISLNDVLLSGPDLNNSLLGVLLRFRRELVAVTADIEQMFHSFIVKEEDRDFLRFLWFKDNDTSKEIIEYRMRVHVFGNSPSPAVAIYGLRRAAAYGEEEYGSDARHFVEREFYVDDGLLSTPTAAETIDLLTRTKKMLATSNLKLHKVASNSKEVMNAFPTEDHAKGLKDLNLEVDPTPIQRSLGLSWDVKGDTFTFHVTDIKKPFTRRGILATVNSLFDPLGFVASVIIEGKFLLRELSGKAKLAPQAAHTIPRLELGAAVLAAEIAEIITNELDFTLDAVEFSTDSRVVLGYIYNQTRQFYVYVANRVQRIHRVSNPMQWHYVSTKHNPADHATRSVPAALLGTTTWLTGPAFLSQMDQNLSLEEREFDLLGPELDTEFRPLATTTYKLSDDREKACSSWHYCAKPRTVKELLQAEEVVIKSVQRGAYQEELTCIAKRNDIPRHSALKKWNPYVDSRGLLRIGGRLKNATLDLQEKFPLIVPGRSHAAKLLVEYYHDRVKHQGRVFTDSAIRNAGYWIVDVRKLINTIVQKCVVCNKLRGKVTEQKMADLPIDRLSTEPPFTHVGLDVFGPWTVVTRHTRGGQAQSKRWAVLFTCMSIRAIQIELIDSMDSSTFINALRRFFALRGPAKQIRSDCRTNFVGACKELGIVVNDPQEPSVRKYLGGEGCSWAFNPPHASHMGGAWERMIAY
ncbi:unnamed protein product [Leuciscus chuanchicus]